MQIKQGFQAKCRLFPVRCVFFGDYPAHNSALLTPDGLSGEQSPGERALFPDMHSPAVVTVKKTGKASVV
jgi:hypothetical protein